MKIKYQCTCHREPIEIEVPDRRLNADISGWMHIVRCNVSYDHEALSPECKTGEATIMIPMNNGQIGGAV